MLKNIEKRVKRNNKNVTLSTHFFTMQTMTPITAAKNMNPLNALSATMAPKFNLAPCVSLFESSSTINGMFTFGD